MPGIRKSKNKKFKLTTIKPIIVKMYCRLLNLKLFLSTLFITIGFLFSGYDLKADSCACDASFVWSDQDNQARNLHVFFRQSVSIGQVPEKAELNVYADSRYLLYVNGAAIYYGPIRSFVKNPVYDTYDLTKYLQPGENVIAVMVRSNGTNTYQLALSQGGFIAWGEIVAGKQKVSLSTPGNWKTHRSKAYETDAPKMSFAAGPIEIHDASKDPVDWNKKGFDDSAWTTPVVLDDQDHWGELLPRNIPFLTQDEILAKKILWKRNLIEDEEIYSFRVKTDDRTQQEFNTQKRIFAYTFIYSPRRQSVDVGTWWGEYYLNGRGPLERRDTPVEDINRQDMTLRLRKGWNFFFVKYDVVWSSWEFHLAIDKNYGLVFSPDKDLDPDFHFRTAGPFSADEEKKVRDLPLPFRSPFDLPELSMGWEDKGPDDKAGNPAWNIAWSKYDIELASEPWQTMDIHVDANRSTALAFDMGGKKLGRIFIDYEAPEGTRFDIAFSEDLLGDRPWVLKRAGIFTAAAHTSSNGSTRFETFKPYGLRYIQINVTGHSEDVKIKRIGVINQIFPFELTGSFSSSDPIMDALWQLGWRTLLVCSEDTYTDTPFRERGLYAGDALPQYAITLAGSGDSRLNMRSLEVFQDLYFHIFQPGTLQQEGAQGNLGDFPLITLENFRWYVEYTGDMDFARRLYEPYVNLINEYRKMDTVNGLFIFPRIFIEWTELRKTNTASTAANALMVRSYRNMAWLAQKLDRPDDAQLFTRYAGELTESILTHCWDDSKGAFHDGFADGEKMDHHYPIQSAYAVLFGLTNETHHERLRTFFAENLADIKDVKRAGLATPYGGYYILGALYKMGEAGTAERFIRQYWSPMIHRHNDTAWENFSDHADGDGQGTLSHAWSGSPTYYMSTQVLGVPLMNDFADETPGKLIIAPQAETINQASGTVPRPEGLVHVSWQISGDNLFVEVEVPQGVLYSVEPRGRLAGYRLVVNGFEM
jgi:alpha-L-rhamnosidase